MQVDSHADGINFNEFIAAMFDAQKLAKAEVAKLVGARMHVVQAQAGWHPVDLS